jgi:large subunit ribosomal protein L17
MLANMAASLVLHERITTTEAKAKAVRSVTEKLITLGKRGTLHARRIALARIPDKRAVHKVFEELALRYADRPGGYTRVYKTHFRQGDGARMAVIELVDRPLDKGKEKAPEKRGLRSRVKGVFGRS